jgi:hypothetical protein
MDSVWCDEIFYKKIFHSALVLGVKKKYRIFLLGEVYVKEYEKKHYRVVYENI